MTSRSPRSRGRSRSSSPARSGSCRHRSSEDDWDRYETLHWRAVEEWLAANPDDPDAAEIRARHERYKRTYLRHGRELPRLGDLRRLEARKRVAHPDIPAEQAYLDHAYECLDRMRQALLRSRRGRRDGGRGRGDRGLGRRAASQLRGRRARLCFGRIDVDSAEDPLYVGPPLGRRRRRRASSSTGRRRRRGPFYTATPAEPHGVTLRRRFRLGGRTLTGISDEALDGSLADAAAAVDDFLLEELDRARDARMRDIVATIQADQYGLIARGPEPPLVIQGGPGTGKTAVGLHRASYLLYAHRDELRRVLVVGPNPSSWTTSRTSCPSLGEDSVDQRAVAELVEGVEVTLVGSARRASG